MGNHLLEPLNCPAQEGFSFAGSQLEIVDTFTPYLSELARVERDISLMQQLANTLSSAGQGLENAYSVVTSVGEPGSGWTGPSATLFHSFLLGHSVNLGKSSSAFLDAGHALQNCISSCEGMLQSIRSIISNGYQTLDAAKEVQQQLQQTTSSTAMGLLTGGSPSSNTSSALENEAKNLEGQMQMFAEELTALTRQVNGQVADFNDETHVLAVQLNDAALLSPHYQQYHAPSFWDDVAGAFTDAWHAGLDILKVEDYVLTKADEGLLALGKDVVHFGEQFLKGFAEGVWGFAKGVFMVAEDLTVGEFVMIADYGFHEHWLEGLAKQSMAFGQMLDALGGYNGHGFSWSTFGHSWGGMLSGMADLHDLESGNIGAWAGNITATLAIALVTGGAGKFAKGFIARNAGEDLATAGAKDLAEQAPKQVGKEFAEGEAKGKLVQLKDALKGSPRKVAEYTRKGQLLEEKEKLTSKLESTEQKLQSAKHSLQLNTKVKSLEGKLEEIGKRGKQVSELTHAELAKDVAVGGLREAPVEAGIHRGVVEPITDLGKASSKGPQQP